MGLFSPKKFLLLNQYFIIESEVEDAKWKKDKKKHILYQRVIENLEIEPQIGDTICGRGTYESYTMNTRKFGRVKERFIFSQPLREDVHSTDYFSYKGEFGFINNDFHMVIELEPIIESILYKTIDETPTKVMLEIFENSSELGKRGFRLRRDQDQKFWNDWYTKFEEEGLV